MLIRFEDMFAQLVLPLCDQRFVHIVANYTEETAIDYRRHVYEFPRHRCRRVGGAYLLKRAFVAYYDLSIWIECSFDTALECAIARAQEGLSPEETVRAYRSIPLKRFTFNETIRKRQPRRSSTMMRGWGQPVGPNKQAG